MTELGNPILALLDLGAGVVPDPYLAALLTGWGLGLPTELSGFTAEEMAAAVREAEGGAREAYAARDVADLVDVVERAAAVVASCVRADALRTAAAATVRGQVLAYLAAGPDRDEARRVTGETIDALGRLCGDAAPVAVETLASEARGASTRTPRSLAALVLGVGGAVVVGWWLWARGRR